MAELPLVDLVSDTATRPTPGMYDAMRNAPLGDEQKGEDPTVNALEKRAAALLGTERAMFLPSATMANQVALALHCGPGDEVIAHKTAHVVNHETGGTAITARAQLMVVDGEHGIFTGETVKRAIRADDPHLPETRVVVVENTSNGGGGSVWPDAAYDSVVDVCRSHRLALHIDGARLMNAAVARGVPASHWAARADTVQLCFSKGLGCPFGAVLGMKDAMWRTARRRKQALGGALRQAGIIAGAMLYALDHQVERLADDHRRARALAEGLTALPGLVVQFPETNLVFFRVEHPKVDAAAFVKGLSQRGVRVGGSIDGRVRACVHLDVDDHGIERAVAAARAVLAD
jgi:threonine aldolase